MLIEHPVGPDAGFWTSFEVFTSMKHAFIFNKNEFGELGKQMMGWMARFYKKEYRCRYNSLRKALVEAQGNSKNTKQE